MKTTLSCLEKGRTLSCPVCPKHLLCGCVHPLLHHTLFASVANEQPKKHALNQVSHSMGDHIYYLHAAALHIEARKGHMIRPTTVDKVRMEEKDSFGKKKKKPPHLGNQAPIVSFLPFSFNHCIPQFDMAAPAYTPVPTSNPFSGAFPTPPSEGATPATIGLGYIRKFREERLSSLRPFAEFFDLNRCSKPNSLASTT